MDHATSEPGVVVFACPHGIAKSRMAAAFFEAAAEHAGLQGWSATTAASEEPGGELSRHAVRLLAGTSGEPFLEPGPGRHLDEVVAQAGHAQVLVVGIDMGPPPWNRLDRAWTLDHQEPDVAMRDEISQLVAGLVATFPGTIASAGRGMSENAE